MARILILTPQLPIPPQALTGMSQGTTIRNFNLIAGLAKRHDVDLLTFRAPAALQSSDAGGARGTSASEPEAAVLDLLRPYCGVIVAEPAPMRTLTRRARDTILNPLPDLALRLSSPIMRQHMTRLLREKPYDVVQVEGVEMAPYVPDRWAAKQPGKTSRPRLVFDDHNAEYVLQKRAFLTDVRRPRRWVAAAYSLVQWRKLTSYERRVCRTADRVVAVSDVDADALRRLAPGLEVTVIPNGVDLEFNRLGAASPAAGMGANALVFTGKMDYRPNVDAVIWFVTAVLPGILAQIPDARFYIVGQQPHVRVQALAEHPAVTVTGRVPDVRPYIAGAAVYVVPLRIGGGTRLKVLEAMAMGRALVSTRLGCDGFDFEQGRQVCFADDPAAFTEAAVGLLRDRARAADLGRHARAYVEAHFGWDAIVPRLEALYA
jgi:glycosyltransferase involved in cell wall biosynthesis